MYNPSRDPAEIIKALDACPYAFSAIKNAPVPEPQNTVKHAAVGKSVKLVTPFGKGIGRRGVASINGAAGLVDGALGLRGNQTDPWWHGVPRGRDFEAVVDLGKEMAITEVSTRFLQSASPTPSFFPVKVEYAVSADGNEFKTVATVDAKDRPKGRVKAFAAKGLGAKGRYLRVKATNGPVPQWHHWRGKKAGWLFLDEIVVNRAK
jgi:hypothetical protein